MVIILLEREKIWVGLGLVWFLVFGRCAYDKSGFMNLDGAS